jgi:hypothetical protein
MLLPLSLSLILAFHCATLMTSTTTTNNSKTLSSLTQGAATDSNVGHWDGTTPTTPVSDDPQIVWLASFPNSGTSTNNVLTNRPLTLVRLDILCGCCLLKA